MCLFQWKRKPKYCCYDLKYFDNTINLLFMYRTTNKEAVNVYTAGYFFFKIMWNFHFSTFQKSFLFIPYFTFLRIVFNLNRRNSRTVFCLKQMEFSCKQNGISKGLKIANWSGFEPGKIVAVKEQANQNLTYSKFLNLITLKYLSTSFPNKNYFCTLRVSMLVLQKK